jgi:hypothetical protein
MGMAILRYLIMVRDTVIVDWEIKYRLHVISVLFFLKKKAVPLHWNSLWNISCQSD